jgi:hypothetical protein
MEILRKLEGKIRKQMNWGSKRWLPSYHLMGYMEATESLKYPYLITRDTSPSRAVLEVVDGENPST